MVALALDTSNSVMVVANTRAMEALKNNYFILQDNNHV